MLLVGSVADRQSVGETMKILPTVGLGKSQHVSFMN
jgi:hypothetical protein